MTLLSVKPLDLVERCLLPLAPGSCQRHSTDTRNLVRMLIKCFRRNSADSSMRLESDKVPEAQEQPEHLTLAQCQRYSRAPTLGPISCEEDTGNPPSWWPFRTQVTTI